MSHAEQVQRAAQVLRQGGLVALPTETVYGLAADASNELAVRRIYAVKGRPATHPLIVHLANAESARLWANTDAPDAQRLMEAFWPGPLTLVLPRSTRASDTVTGGQDTVALRVPSHPLARAVLSAFGGGVAAPSANRFGRVSPTTAEHVRADLGNEVDLVLDGGPATVGVESTIVDLSHGAPTILRPGGVPKEELERALGRPVPVQSEHTVRAPGLLPSHYAPRAGLELCAPNELAERVRTLVASGRKVAVLGPSALPLPPGARHFPVPPDDGGFARALYALLREADEAGVETLVAAAPEEKGLGLAVLDRLRRASAPRP